MDNRTHQLFHDSLDRCTRDPRFMETFYDRFLGTSDEIAALFQHTDMAAQRRKLRASLYLCMQAATGNSEAMALCRSIAATHTGIKAAFYEVWLETLLGTVRDFDDRFGDDTEQAWRDILRPGIELFKKVAVNEEPE